MPIPRLLPFLLLAAGLAAAAAHSAEAPARQRLLLSALDQPSQARAGGWRLDNARTDLLPTASGVKAGSRALRLRGEAAEAGAKGDFGIAEWLPGGCRKLGIWFYLSPTSNAATVGLQVQDAEGESLIYQVPAEGQGWKQVAVDPASGEFKQSYPQAGKNGKVDQPIRAVQAVWFAKAKGHTEVGVDGLEATVDAGAEAKPGLALELGPDDWMDAGSPLQAAVTLTNYAAQGRPVQVEIEVQHDPAYYSVPTPDPVWGSNHALGAKSWTEADGKRIEEGSLTDGRDNTSAETEYRGKHWKEAFQYVDLGRERRITRLTWQAGDANWVWKVDVDGSLDGKSYAPLPGLTGFELYKKWGQQTMPLASPTAARFLRLRYHHDGEVTDVIRMPAELGVYDGAADESWTLPSVGEKLLQQSRTESVPARDFASLPITMPKPLPTGAYLIAVRAKAGSETAVAYRHVLALPPAFQRSAEASHFGLNVSSPAQNPPLGRLGIGWVRFENLKWPMVSPGPNDFRFDGSVAPWRVDHDALMDGYRAQDLNILPFLFLTADYATSAPANIKRDRWGSYPPKDNALMQDFVYQTVARYGSTKHPAADLKTPDKKSGLNKIHVYEIWNEPNLTAPEWGPWVGTSDQYLDMFRAASEAAKKADPQALVTNAGYAGISLEIVDELVRHKYRDGKCALDFTDVLNVHYYTGPIPPEQATLDPNSDRSGAKAGSEPYEAALEKLVQWRDENKPGLPIWMTETGNDTGGPWGVPEAWQAARLPRTIMLALASGIDKVFVYRESGSTPSLHAASGLYRDDGSVKPLWLTYATLIRELDGVKPGVRLPYPDPNVRLYTWIRNNETVLTGWTVSGSASVKLDLGPCMVTDAFGYRKQEKVAALALSPFPTYVRGIGNPAGLKSMLDEAQVRLAAERRDHLRDVKRHAYLYDFGSTTSVGMTVIGNIRHYTPVLSANVFSEKEPAGFFPHPALGDDIRTWVQDPLERDGCKLDKSVSFRFKAAPGKYRLRLSASPFDVKGKATVTGAVGGEKTLGLTREGPAVELLVEVGTEPITVTFDSYTWLRWLTLVEEPG